MIHKLQYYFQEYTILSIGLIIFGISIGVWIKIISFKLSRKFKRLERIMNGYEKKLEKEDKK